MKYKKYKLYANSKSLRYCSFCGKFIPKGSDIHESTYDYDDPTNGYKIVSCGKEECWKQDINIKFIRHRLNGI